MRQSDAPETLQKAPARQAKARKLGSLFHFSPHATLFDDVIANGPAI